MATYTKSLSQRNTAKEKELEKEYKQIIKDNLNITFQMAIEEQGFNLATIELLENRLDIVSEITNTIYNIKRDNKYIFEYYGKEKIYNDIYSQYMKEYSELKKTYNTEQKAKKEYYIGLIYNIVIEDIEEGKKEGLKIEDIRRYIQNSKYKELIQKDFISKVRNFDKSIFDSVYNLTINKVLRVYKTDESEQQETNQNKIPLGWLIYGTLKAINKRAKI